jgi:hypothetical protein
MTTAAISRRHLVTATALGAIAMAPGRAAAWSTGPSDAETERLYRSACARDAHHGRLARQVRARLAGLMPAASIDRALAAMKCPVCRCRLI